MPKRPQLSPEEKQATFRLAKAISLKQPDVGFIEQLIAQGANVNDQEGGWSLLMEACDCGHERVIDLLIAAGANVNAATTRGGDEHDKGQTALHVAAEKGHFGIVKKLLAAGADASARTARGRTATAFALEAPNDCEVVKVLLDVAAPLCGLELHVAAKARDVDLVRRLLALGVDVNAPAPENYCGITPGATPLHVAQNIDLALEERQRKLAAEFHYADHGLPSADVLRQRQLEIIALLKEAGGRPTVK